MSKVEKFVTVKPRGTYQRGMNANGVKVLPGSRKTYCVREDKHGKMYTGVEPEYFEKTEIAKTIKYRDFFKTYSVSLSDSEIKLNITDEDDYIKYKFLLSQYPQVVDHPSKVTPHTEYILFNEEEEAEVRNASREAKIKAMAILNEMTNEQKTAFLRLYGWKTDSMTITKITDELYNQIEKTVDKTTGLTGAEEFMNKFNAKDKNERVLLKSLIQNEVLTKKGQAVYFGTEPIGANEDFAVEYIVDPKNADMKANWITILKSKQGNK